MTEIALADAKNRLSELIARVQAGEAFVITRRGKAVARLALPDGPTVRDQARDAIAQLRALRQSVDLGAGPKGAKTRDLIRHGRR